MDVTEKPPPITPPSRVRSVVLLTADWLSGFFQVNEIYHDESLGVHINVVLVRMIMLGYAKVRLTVAHSNLHLMHTHTHN